MKLPDFEAWAVFAAVVEHRSFSAAAGLVRIAAPLTFGIKHLAPVLADFLEAHPGIKIDLRLSDAFVDIVGDGVDIALRIAELPDSSLRARRLGPVTAHVIAAPVYFEKHGRPRHPADLASHACFTYTNTASPDYWRFRKAGGEEASVRVDGPIRTDSGDAMLPALRAGLGVAILPGFIVDADIAAGRLEAVLTDWTIGASALHLITPPGTLRPARVEALIEFLSDRLKRMCSEPR
jgi:DNA-binding transcriptional LysR family regulator